jgi:hypothetical protein
LTPIEFAYYATGTAIALGGIIYGIAKISKFAHRLAVAVGADKNGRTIAERMDRVEHQLWENGGSSLADRVNNLTIESKETVADLKFIKKIMIANYHVDFLDEDSNETTPVTVVVPKRATRKK